MAGCSAGWLGSLLGCSWARWKKFRILDDFAGALGGGTRFEDSPPASLSRSFREKVLAVSTLELIAADEVSILERSDPGAVPGLETFANETDVFPSNSWDMRDE